MPTRRRTTKDTPAKLAKRMSRRWRVVLLRAKGEILGTVEAPDVAAAKAAAAVQFELDDVQRNRIIVQSWLIAGLAEVQEPAGSCGEAGGGRGLGSLTS